MGKRRKRRRRNKNLFYFRFAAVVILFIICINLIKGGIAKYKSEAESNAEVDLAFYIVKVNSISQDLKLDNILPRAQAYTYSFSVSNYDGELRTETALQYTVQLKTTTNLPLSYQIYKDGEQPQNPISTVPEQDDDGTYFKYITFNGSSFGFNNNETHLYHLNVIFPEAYNLAEYEGIVEYVQVTVNAEQKTS